MDFETPRPPMSSPLDYALSSLRRAAEIGYPWSVSPSEAAAVVAEVERLRAGLSDIEQIVRDGMAAARAAALEEAAVLCATQSEAETQLETHNIGLPGSVALRVQADRIRAATKE